MVEQKQFRTDLFYRLNVIPLWVPPLRARREDVELLATHFCSTFAAANAKPALHLDAGAMRVLRAQRWPGNVRQLQNFIERLVVLAPSGVIDEPLVREELSRQVTFKTQPGTTAARINDAVASPPSVVEAPSVILSLDAEVRAAEKGALERALLHCRGNRSLAARLLGVSRTTLYAKLQEYGLL
jgi:two-component system response regulator AtoC